MPLWVAIAVILVTIMRCPSDGFRRIRTAPRRAKEQLRFATNRITPRKAAYYKAFLPPHKIQFVIQAGYGMERFLRHSFSPFPEYHKCDTIIRTFKFYNIVFPILPRYLGQGSLIRLPCCHNSQIYRKNMRHSLFTAHNSLRLRSLPIVSVTLPLNWANQVNY